MTTIPHRWPWQVPRLSHTTKSDQDHHGNLQAPLSGTPAQCWTTTGVATLTLKNRSIKNKWHDYISYKDSYFDHTKRQWHNHPRGGNHFLHNPKTTSWLPTAMPQIPTTFRPDKPIKDLQEWRHQNYKGDQPGRNWTKYHHRNKYESG